MPASHLVQGKVERAGDNIEIVVSLVRASDGRILWTNSYRRHVADLSAVEAEIAVAIRTSLSLTPPALAVKHNPPPDAHDAYLKGRFEANFAVAYDAPNAAKWMERSMNAREGPALYIRVDPQLAKVQTDPAFRTLKRRMNLDW